ncbi:hypothetical protein KIH86_08480 [Paenibacillus sp. HN-1]|uniref:hypothetical protein n=1 Tax=Paenibacillus TaxID=44249 RepID=UPI001CA7DEE1|nr:MULTISPECIES: hypothetical protein [Paenibacillus]MBY9079586.1 hypothetical protein [Paenibacillus sp. CGMCC 1.18879]MBY9084275.1 hypothetical protein [Paenibacillus sinensis]
MKLHLVFEASLLPVLKAALQEREYDVSGTDVTLEQFQIAVEAGSMEADTVLMDGTLGVNRSESVKLLKSIRVAAPDLRLIVILSSADTQWVKELGMLGIYDVYVTEQFQLADIESWLHIKKTLADVPDFGEQGVIRSAPSASSPDVQFQSKREFNDTFKRHVQRIGNWMAQKRDESRNKRAEAAAIKKLEAEAEQEGNEEQGQPPEVLDDEKPAAVGLRFDFPKRAMTIGVIGLKPRSGTTHAVLALASSFAKVGYKVAAIECQQPDKPSDFASLAYQMSSMQLQEGITLYPNVTAERIPALLSLPFDLIVLDLGSMAEERASPVLSEWLRSDLQLAVLSAAPWDLRDVVQRRTELTSVLTDIRGYVLVNFADEGMFKETSKLLEPFRVSVLHVPYAPNPFEGDSKWVEPILPGKGPKKRRFMKTI